MVWLPDGEKIEDMVTRFGRIHKRDGRTDKQSDRQTDGHRVTAYRPRLHSIARQKCNIQTAVQNRRWNE